MMQNLRQIIHRLLVLDGVFTLDFQLIQVFSVDVTCIQTIKESFVDVDTSK